MLDLKTSTNQTLKTLSQSLPPRTNAPKMKGLADLATLLGRGCSCLGRPVGREQLCRSGIQGGALRSDEQPVASPAGAGGAVRDLWQRRQQLDRWGPILCLPVGADGCR